MTKRKTSERVLDFFFILGTVLVLFPHFSKDYIPSFLFPFFGSDMVLSIYPFFIFSLLAIFLLFQKGEYKKILFLVFSCVFFCFGFLVITEHGLHMILSDVTEYDVQQLDGSRLSFFNLVTKFFGDKDITFRLSVSEGLFSLYAAFNQYKEIYMVCFLILFSYQDRIHDAKKNLFVGLIVSFAFVILYELIEFPFLWGSEWSIELQKKIKPFLHLVNRDGTWWPPLIWQDHVLRSVFAEPSFFGYYLGFTTVAFIHLLLNYKHKIIWAVLLFLSSWFGFLTNSRSGVMLVLGGTAVYCLLYLIKERNIKGILVVILVIGLAFIGNNLVEKIKVEHGTATAAIVEKEEDNTVVSPIDGSVFEVLKASFEPAEAVKNSFSESSVVQTFKTVFSLTARSNVTRYGCTIAELSIGLSNPIFGVGELYIGNYLPGALNELGFGNYELAGWTQRQEESGALNNEFASFNAFTSSFAEGGIVGFVLEVGLLLFLVVSYLIVFLKTKRKDVGNFSLMLFSMLAVIFAWGFSNNFQESYLYVVTLGIALADVATCRRLLKEGKTKV